MSRVRATDPRIARQAEHAFRAAQRGSKLTAQLLAFSRTQKLATVAVDLNRLITGMGPLITQTLGAEIIVEMDLARELPHSLGDANHLELAILNLAINARDAMPNGGRLTISTRQDPENSERVIVGVSDTGTGMPPEVLAAAIPILQRLKGQLEERRSCASPSVRPNSPPRCVPRLTPRLAVGAGLRAGAQGARSEFFPPLTFLV